MVDRAPVWVRVFRFFLWLMYAGVTWLSFTDHVADHTLITGLIMH